jgi:PEP-CTERM motif
MKATTSTALLITSAIAGGAARGAIVYSGTLNLTSTWTSDSSGTYGYGRLPVDIVSTAPTADFVFGYDTASTKPYIDARTTSFPTLANPSTVFLLDKSDGGSGNGSGLPLTTAGTVIDASYAATYPGNASDNQGMFYNDSNNNGPIGDWSGSAVTDGYVGIELTVGANTDYGWLHFIDNPTLANPTLTLVDWAYDNAGAGIAAGAMGVPEPSSVALFGLGIASLVFSARKRRCK